MDEITDKKRRGEQYQERAECQGQEDQDEAAQ
jgi:hypothetical protein